MSRGCQELCGYEILERLKVLDRMSPARIVSINLSRSNTFIRKC